MATVTITVTPRGVIVQPPTVPINRVDQEITWILRGAEWEPDGIVMDMSPPPPFHAWPGKQPSRVGDNYVGNAEDALPEGSPPQMYRYTINIKDGQGARLTQIIHPETEISIDPDVVNQPTP